MFGRTYVVMVAGLLAFGCAATDGGGTKKGSGAKCETDKTCPRGSVCLGGGCGAATCESFDDCADGQLCVADPAGAAGKVCTAVECSTGADCKNGGTCENGLCIGGGVIDDGCSVTKPCPTGQTCGEDGKCKSDTAPGAGAQCGTCAADGDCQAGFCATLTGGKNCIAECATNGDCESGFVCTEIDGKKGCAPGTFECSGCLSGADCGATQHCNGNTGQCADNVAACAPCTQDGDCGAGSRCYGKQDTTSKFCVPECPSDSCPVNGSCEELSEGVKACVWGTSGPCCLGEGCGGGDPCAACSGNTPYCTDDTKQCAACLDDSHCPLGDAPTCDNGVCVAEAAEECTDPKLPYYNAAKDTCCQCLKQSHCGGKPCDPNTCQCPAPTGGVCDTCVDPYPGCATYNGQEVCVQCAANEDCPSNECDTKTYTCKGTVNPTGNCKDKGCADPVLSCDEASGLCINPTGNCDNITQFCPNGAKCISFLDQLPGGFGGALPPLPDGGGLPGGCECTPGALPGFDQGDCPDGLTCSQGLFGLIALFDPTLKIPYSCGKGFGQ